MPEITGHSVTSRVEAEKKQINSVLIKDVKNIKFYRIGKQSADHNTARPRSLIVKFASPLQSRIILSKVSLLQKYGKRFI